MMAQTTSKKSASEVNLDRERRIITRSGDCKIVKGSEIVDTWNIKPGSICKNELYIIHALPITPKDPKDSTVDICLPAEILDIDIEDDNSLLKWTQEHEVPNPVHLSEYGHQNRFQWETRSIHALIPLEECRKQLADIKLAMTLRMALQEKDDSLIRATLSFKEEKRGRKIVSQIPHTFIENSGYDWLSGENRDKDEDKGACRFKRKDHEDNFAEDSDSARFIASCVLYDLLNHGLTLYPTHARVRFKDVALPPGLREFEACASPAITHMSFIWETLKRALCEKKRGRKKKK